MLLGTAEMMLGTRSRDQVGGGGEFGAHTYRNDKGHTTCDTCTRFSFL